LFDLESKDKLIFDSAKIFFYHGERLSGARFTGIYLLQPFPASTHLPHEDNAKAIQSRMSIFFLRKITIC
jgi:hypothetical protein